MRILLHTYQNGSNFRNNQNESLLYQMLAGHRATRTLTHCWQKCKMVVTLKNGLAVSYNKGKHTLTIQPWNPTQVGTKNECFSAFIQLHQKLFTSKSHSLSGINQSYFPHPQFFIPLTLLFFRFITNTSSSQLS